jgi:hypothetical protein
MTAADWTELAVLMQTRADLELAVGDTRLAQGYRRRRDYAARKAQELGAKPWGEISDAVRVLCVSAAPGRMQ